jgi:hypothetical protein
MEKHKQTKNEFEEDKEVFFNIQTHSFPYVPLYYPDLPVIFFVFKSVKEGFFVQISPESKQIFFSFKDFAKKVKESKFSNLIAITNCEDVEEYGVHAWVPKVLEDIPLDIIHNIPVSLDYTISFISQKNKNNSVEMLKRTNTAFKHTPVIQINNVMFTSKGWIDKANFNNSPHWFLVEKPEKFPSQYIMLNSFVSYEPTRLHDSWALVPYPSLPREEVSSNTISITSHFAPGILAQLCDDVLDMRIFSQKKRWEIIESILKKYQGPVIFQMGPHWVRDTIKFLNGTTGKFLHSKGSIFDAWVKMYPTVPNTYVDFWLDNSSMFKREGDYYMLIL